MKTRSIRQSVTLKTDPEDVYNSIMNSRIHAKFTKAKASISRKIGGNFSAYDGYIDGVNLDLVPGKKIVQLWRCHDWPEGHYSRVTFSLKKIRGGTLLAFYQSGVPEKHYTEINKGWHEAYWEPMKKMLQQQNK